MFKSKSSKFLKRQQLEQAAALKQAYLGENCHRTYSCIHCRAHLANHDELISKLFQGNHGRAYLFNKVVNIGCKQAVERELLTGLHAVADIYCDCCETTLGWKYEQAFVPSQKYKEGKYIIELVHMLKENNWDLTSYNSEQLLEDKANEANANKNQLRLVASGANGEMMVHHHRHHHLYSAKQYSRPAHRSVGIRVGTNNENDSGTDIENSSARAEEGKRPQVDVDQARMTMTTRCKTTTSTATTRETIRIDSDSSVASLEVEPLQVP